MSIIALFSKFGKVGLLAIAMALLFSRFAFANAVFEPQEIMTGRATIRITLPKLAENCNRMFRDASGNAKEIPLNFWDTPATIGGVSTEDTNVSCNDLRNGVLYTGVFPHAGQWYLAISPDTLDTENPRCDETLCHHGVITAVGDLVAPLSAEDAPRAHGFFVRTLLRLWLGIINVFR